MKRRCQNLLTRIKWPSRALELLKIFCRAEHGPPSANENENPEPISAWTTLKNDDGRTGASATWLETRAKDQAAGEPLAYARSDFASESPVTDPTERAAALPNDWKLIGYLHNTYILLQTTDGLSIVEQHIAHERTLYERLLAQLNEPQRPEENYQRLIVSCPLNLTLEQSACLEQNIDHLKALGFEFEAASTPEPLETSDANSDAAASSKNNEPSFACVQVPIELAHQDYPRRHSIDTARS